MCLESKILRNLVLAYIFELDYNSKGLTLRMKEWNNALFYWARTKTRFMLRKGW